MTQRWIPVSFADGLLIIIIVDGQAAWAQTTSVPFCHSPPFPTAAAPGGRSFHLTVDGAGFVPGSTIQWNGSALDTTFVSNARVTATVPDESWPLPEWQRSRS